ncbi:hypothetical protein [Nocardia gipuzkoensis]
MNIDPLTAITQRREAVSATQTRSLISPAAPIPGNSATMNHSYPVTRMSDTTTAAAVTKPIK